MTLARLSERAAFAGVGRAGSAAWAPAVAVALHLGLGFVLYSSSGPDDVHITYAAAANLLRHGAITNYNGDPIEQSSSVAHVDATRPSGSASSPPVARAMSQLCST